MAMPCYLNLLDSAAVCVQVVHIFRDVVVQHVCFWLCLLACVANTLMDADHDEHGHSLLLKATKLGFERLNIADFG